jgi:hypothetical protein
MVPIHASAPAESLHPPRRETWLDTPANDTRSIEHPEPEIGRPSLTARSSLPIRSPLPAFAAIEDDCLLRHGRRWVTIPEPQLPLARALLDPPGRIVTWRDIHESYARSTGSINRPAARAMIYRLTARFREVGLEVRNVRGVGFRVQPTGPATPGQ